MGFNIRVSGGVQVQGFELEYGNVLRLLVSQLWQGEGLDFQAILIICLHVFKFVVQVFNFFLQLFSKDKICLGLQLFFVTCSSLVFVCKIWRWTSFLTTYYICVCSISYGILGSNVGNLRLPMQVEVQISFSNFPKSWTFIFRGLGQMNDKFSQVSLH